MAVIWSEWIDDNLYEVRTAGASVRLYRNGVNHSQYNPRRPLAGSIWDLLVLPTLFQQPPIETALMLGFGAGVSARLLQHLATPKTIVGIDLDPIHLSIADSFFGCAEGCELMAADAVEWVDQTLESAGPKFDLLLDDLFTESDGIPQRCGPASIAWFKKLAKLVSDDGMLIVNWVEPENMQSLPLLSDRKLVQRFPHAIQLSIAAYDNRVLAFSRLPFDRQRYRRRLQEFCSQFPACRGVGNRYRLRSLRQPT